MTYKPIKLGQTDLVLQVLCIAVMICVTLVNTQTHIRQLFTDYNIGSAI